MTADSLLDPILDSNDLFSHLLDFEQSPEVTERAEVYRQQAKANRRRMNESRKLRELGLPDTFTDEEWAYALRYWDNRCAYCRGLPFPGRCSTVLHREHYIPVTSNGGRVRTNMLPVCARCNHEKWDRDPEQWIVDRFLNGKSIIVRIQTYFTLVGSK